MFGIGFAISIPLVALAFAVDNVGLLMKRTFNSLISWTRNPSRRRIRRGRSRSPTPIERIDMVDLRRRKDSRESYKRRSHESGYGTDSDGALSPIRNVNHKPQGEPELKRRISGGSEDLERGIDGAS